MGDIEKEEIIMAKHMKAEEKYSEIYKAFCHGMQLLLWGLIEIIVIGLRARAYTLAVVAQENIGAIYVFAAIFVCALELYLYIDGVNNIERGLFQCFGKTFRRNVLINKKNNWKSIFFVIFLYIGMLVYRVRNTTIISNVFRNGLIGGEKVASFFEIKKTLLAIGIEEIDYKILAGMVLFLLIIELLHIKGVSVREWIDRRNIIFRWMIYLFGILLVAVFGYYGI